MPFICTSPLRLSDVLRAMSVPPARNVLHYSNERNFMTGSSKISQTVLIVDDEEVWRSLLGEVLSRYRYRTIAASCGAEAIRLFAAERPDAVILDLRLPDMDGIGVLKELIRINSDAPVVIISGYGDIPAAVEAMRAGAGDFIAKPINRHLLLHAIQRVITEARQKQEIRDLTAQRDASESRYRILVETAQDLIWSVDTDGRITFVNKAAHVVYGYEDGELTGRSFIDYIVPEDRNRVLASFQGMLQTGAEVRGLEFTAFAKNGSRVVMSTNSAALRNDRGVIMGIMGSSRDITLQKQREEQMRQYQKDLETLVQQRAAALRESEERLRLAQQGANVGIWDRDIPTGKVNWTAELEVLYGYEPGAFPGSSAGFIDRVHPDDRADIENKRDEAIAAHRPFDYDFRIMLPSGQLRWLNCKGTAYYDSTGTPIRVLGINIDITRHKQMEAELRANEEKYRAIFENSLACILLTAPDGRIFRANSAACRCLRMTEEDICAAGTEQLLDTTDPRLKRWLELRATTGNFQGELTFLRPDGTRFPAEVFSSVYRNEANEERASVIFRDISAYKEAEALLRDYARRLIDIEENMKKKIAAELHDEIGRDLTALGMNVTIIRDSFSDAPSPHSMQRLEDASRLIGNISRTVRGIMAGLRPPVLDDYGLAAAIRWHAGLFQKRSGIDVSIDIQGYSTRLPVETELALFRIYQEALVNASRHASPTMISVRLRASEDRILLAIEDDGVGFDAASCRTAAEPGMGLKIMRERAEAMGARLQLESCPGSGTLLTVTAPRSRR
ncbi:MAG: hypothetical protein OHK006_19860 [Thermodesulfovibrionales bacterium]